MTDDLLTVEDAARLAHVSPETIKYWVKTKRLAPSYKRTTKTGKPWGLLIPRAELEKANPAERVSQLKSSHAGNLLTVGEIQQVLQISRDLSYRLVKHFNLEKHYIDGCQYMVDGEELWQKMRDDPIYWYLTLRK